jgi:hypothetical protein
MDYSSAELRQQGMTLQRFVVGCNLFTSDSWPNPSQPLQTKLNPSRKGLAKDGQKTLS